MQKKFNEQQKEMGNGGKHKKLIKMKFWCYKNIIYKLKY